MLVSRLQKSNLPLSVQVQGKKNWYEVLQTPGLRFGRTDPATDPQGQNIIFAMLLAQSFYKQPGLADKILDGYQNQQQIFAEPSLLSRLEAGQIDASSGYLSDVGVAQINLIGQRDERQMVRDRSGAAASKSATNLLLGL